MGKLRLGTKSDIVSCLENLIDIDEVSNPKVDAVILDGAAIVHMLRPGTADTFSEYASKILADTNLPSPGEWGWVQTVNGGWEVKWTELPEASQACCELIRCSCNKGCRSQCKCVKAALECTALCQCDGLCDRS